MSFILHSAALFQFDAFSPCIQVVMPVGGKIVDTFTDKSAAYITILGENDADIELVHFHVASEDALLFSDSYEHIGVFKIETTGGSLRLHLFKIPTGDWGIYSQEYQNKYGKNTEMTEVDTENIRRLLSGFEG